MNNYYLENTDTMNNSSFVTLESINFDKIKHNEYKYYNTGIIYTDYANITNFYIYNTDIIVNKYENITINNSTVPRIYY